MLSFSWQSVFAGAVGGVLLVVLLFFAIGVGTTELAFSVPPPEELPLGEAVDVSFTIINTRGLRTDYLYTASLIVDGNATVLKEEHIVLGNAEGAELQVLVQQDVPYSNATLLITANGQRLVHVFGYVS